MSTASVMPLCSSQTTQALAAPAALATQRAGPSTPRAAANRPSAQLAKAT